MKILSVSLLICALAACGPRATGDDSEGAIRIPLGVASAATPTAVTPLVPLVPMVWTHAQSARAAWYGPPDAPAQLAIACEGWESREARLRIVRYVPADRGARAVLAIQGSKGILRLPVSAVRAGDGHAWRGEIAAGDPRVPALLGDGLKITVPGGGMLTPAAMGGAGAVVSQCIADAAPLAAAGLQTLPNRPSNPATSPAAR